VVVVKFLQEVVKNLDKLDEAFLTTLNGWMTKVQEDEQNKAMVRGSPTRRHMLYILIPSVSHHRPDMRTVSFIGVFVWFDASD